MNNKQTLRFFLKRAGLAIGLFAFASSITPDALAAGDYPIKKPKQMEWSFSGPFGHWDVGQLQRGLKVYKKVCSACHGIEYVSFRNLKDLGYNDEQVKAFASDYEVTDGPNADGEMFTRPAVAADRIPGPYQNNEAAAAANNGAVPPDFSLLAKARAPERGFPTFIFDIFTMYAENGPDYIYSLMSGYEDAPEGVEIGDATHYNPYFIAGNQLAMASPLSDGVVTYDDGAPETVDQYAKDIAAFMMWAAEPKLVERKALGLKVMIFLLILTALMYLTKKKIWSGLASPSGSNNRSVGLAASGKKLQAGIDYIDDIELIDGIGATIAKRLKNEGVGSLGDIASMSASKLDSLAAKINAKNRHIREEWREQALELISGKPPRAQVDRDRVAKLLAKNKK